MKKLPLSMIILALAASAPAWAGDDEEAGSDGADDATEEGSDDAGAASSGDDKAAATTASDKPADGADAAATPADKPIAEETIFVVQGKPYLMHGRFEVTPQLVQTVNDSFTSHTGAMVSGVYHFKENVAVELVAGAFGWWDDLSNTSTIRLGGRDSDLTTELREKENLAPERVKLYQFPWLVAGDLQWSPMYGKVDVQDLVLGQFQLYLSVGAGALGLQLETVTPGVPVKEFVELQTPVALTTSFGGGLRFLFTDWLGVRLDVRDYVTPLGVTVNGANAIEDADSPSFDVTNTILAQGGVSFVF